MTRPVVGITSMVVEREEHHVMSFTYVEAVAAVGGCPVVLPATGDPEASVAALDRLDAVLFTGGPDVDPAHFHQLPHTELGEISPRRDAAELALARAALAAGKPILAICRGIQLLAVAAGGTVVQDIGSQVPGVIKHRQQAPRWYGSHPVTVAEDSTLARALGATSLMVNSFHHQAVDQVPPGFRVVARAPDGVVEGMEPVDGSPVLGVQWHPEGMFDHDERARSLFAYLVARAGEAGR